MNSSNRWTRPRIVLLVAACMAFAVSLMAQVQTQTSTSAGTPTKEVKVDRAEVVYIDGNDLVLRMEDGTIRHIRNVPESAKLTVNGKEIGIHDVKVGMKLERTITTTTTPKLVTTVQTVTGKVWHVNPPNFVILTLDDGSNQGFNIPNGQKFNINGEVTDAWGLKKGMTVSATKVVEEPVTDVTVHQQLTATEPPPPPPAVPILVAVLTPVPPPRTAPPAELPKTGSLLPLLGLLGGLSLAASFLLRALRSIS
jgi:hypothetical protein